MAKFILQTDGGARGNPGPAGAGVVILDHPSADGGEVVKTAKKFLGGNLTNNEAEYLALIFGLENLQSLVEKSGEIKKEEVEILIKLDSELVVKQLTGVYKVKEARLKELVKKAKEKTAGFPRVSFVHIPREENKLADKLANEAMDYLS